MIGIVDLYYGASGKKGFYNGQEVGLAKELDKLCDGVIVYKFVTRENEQSEEPIPFCEHAVIRYLPVYILGSNPIPDCSKFDAALDALICFSDTQLAVPAIYKWTRKNNIPFIPYIGVTESHSTNKIKKSIMDLLFRRNQTVYQKCNCVAKTPNVKEKLLKMGISRVTVVPVGLDLSLINQSAQNAEPVELKEKFGYQAEDKVLLFVGRLIEEKQPLRMIDIFSRLSKTDGRYKLLMVGSGEMKEAVVSAIREYGIEDKVQMIERIPNAEIWELYCLADCFVNLNQQEIFGMAILEAMYYGCKVVAWKAPGPSFIIEDGVSGCLADSDEEIKNAILDRSIVPEAAHTRIVNSFTWECTAREILRIASNNEGDT